MTIKDTEQAKEFAARRWRHDPKKLDLHVDQVVARYPALTAEQRQRLVAAEREHAADGAR